MCSCVGRYCFAGQAEPGDMIALLRPNFSFANNVDVLFNLGMRVSCSCLLQLTSDLGNGLCDQFYLDSAVCPPKMHSGLFTVATADNIDYNPSPATAKDSFRNFSCAAFFL